VHVKLFDVAAVQLLLYDKSISLNLVPLNFKVLYARFTMSMQCKLCTAAAVHARFAHHM